jgi:hypothetical protein
MIDVVIVFLIGLLLAFVLSRLGVSLFIDQAKLPFYRKFKLTLHHFHFGILLITIAIFVLLEKGVTQVTSFLLGLGLGCVWDEMPSSLFMKTKRKDEMESYEKGLFGTVIVFLVFTVITLLLYFL